MELNRIYAEKLRDALKSAVDTRKLAEAWAALHPRDFASKALDPALAAFLSRAGQAIRAALAKVLPSAWTEGWALGQQSAVASAVSAASADLPAVNWGDWTPGDVEAAYQVAGSGLRDLLASQEVTIKSIAGSRLEELGDILAAHLSSPETERPLLPEPVPPMYSVDSLADALEGVLDNPERAYMVAQTEIARASQTAAQWVFRQMGVDQVRVSTAGDRRVCPVCQSAEAAGAQPVGTYTVPLHPRCFPAGTLVSGPRAVAATGRHYEGDLVTVVFVVGEDLAATPNHPVLTPAGWIPVGELRESDHVFRAHDGIERALACPDDEQVVLRIEDVAHALAEAGGVSAVRVPVAAEDFHGDGCPGHDVDVVAPARHAVGHAHALGGDGRAKVALVGGHGVAPLRPGDGGTLGVSLDASPAGVVGGVEHGGPLGVGGVLPPQAHGGRPAPAVDAGGAEHAVDGVAVDAVAAGERLDGLAAQEVGDQAVWGGVHAPVLDEAEGAELLEHGGDVDSGDGRALAGALAGLVSLDRVTELRRVSWSGHVYNLETVDGWYFANGIVAHNCRCATVAVSPPLSSSLPGVASSLTGAAT